MFDIPPISIRQRHLISRSVFIAVLLLWAAMFFWQCYQREPSVEDSHEMTNKDVSDQKKLSDPASCGKCHTKAYSLWKDSHHGLALRKPVDTLFRKLPDTVRLSHNRTYIFSKRKGSDSIFVQTNDSEGGKGNFLIQYIIGVDPLLQYIAALPKGKMQCLTFAFDVHKKEYFDLKFDVKAQPNEWLHWTGSALNWNASCADCHSNEVKKNYSPGTDSYQTTFRHINVSCESCHGQAKVFPQDTTACWLPKAQRTEVSTQKGQIESCAACHSRRMQLSEHSGKKEAYDDVYALEPPSAQTFHGDGQIKDEVFEYHSFNQSKMFSKGVKCSNCHSPHSGKLIAKNNALCLQCHQKETFDVPQHHHHTINSTGAQCVNCHMPTKMYMQRHLRHDHSLRVPRPDLSVQFNTPNACNQCHANKTASWAAKAIETWTHHKPKEHFSDIILKASPYNKQSMDKLIAFIQSNHSSDVARMLAMNKLSELGAQVDVSSLGSILAKDSSAVIQSYAMQMGYIISTHPSFKELILNSKKSVRIQAARAAVIENKELKGVGGDDQSMAQASKEYNLMMLFGLDNPSISLDYANVLYQQNQVQKSIQYYKHTLRLDNQMTLAYLNLSEVYLKMGSLDSAEVLLQLANSLIYRNEEILYALGLVQVKKKNFAEAVLSISAALKINPINQDYALALALLEVELGHKAKAISMLKKLAKENPNTPYYRTILVQTLGKFK